MRCNMSNDKKAEGGTFVFKLGTTKKSKAKVGLQTLPDVQDKFKDNCLNIALNQAKLESAGAFTAGADILCTTTGTYAVLPDGSRRELFVFDDYRSRQFAIATDPIDIANIDAANAKKAAEKKAAAK